MAEQRVARHVKMTAMNPLSALTLDHDALPLWMRRARRGIDYGALLVMILCAVVALPFVTGIPLSAFNDHAFGLRRMANVLYGLEEGTLYLRWASHTLYGYGAPIFHFTPPLGTYLPAFLTFFITDDPATSLRLTFAASFFMAGQGMYGVALRRGGAAAGIVAAALYLLCPVVALTAPHILGTAGLSLALGILPALLWAVDRVITASRPIDVLMLTGAMAGLLLADTDVGIAGTILAISYGLWLSVTEQRRVPADGRKIRLLIGGMLAGLCVAAFFWLPALLEADNVRWLPASIPLPVVTFGALVRPPALIDPAALNPIPIYSVGIPLLILPVIGVMIWVQRRRQIGLRSPLPFWIAASTITIVAALLTTVNPAAGVGLLCCTLSLASASVMPSSTDGMRGRLIVAGTLVVLVSAAFPSLLPPRAHPSTVDTTPQGQVFYETEGYGNALLPPWLPVPVTLPALMQPDNRVITAYSTGNGATGYTDGLTNTFIIPLTQGSQHERFQVQTTEAARMRIITSAFEGWQASFSGLPLPLATDENGLLIVDLPAQTTGELTIRLESTPLRTLAWALCVAGVLLAVILFSRAYRHQQMSATDDAPILDIPTVRLCAAIIGLYAVCGLVIVIGGLTAQPTSGLPASLLRMDATSTEGIRLIGGEAIRQAGDDGQPDELSVTLYWDSMTQQRDSYVAHIFLLSLADGSRWAFTASQAPGDLATERWSTGRYVRDSHTIPLPTDLPAGQYTVAVELFLCNNTCDPSTRLFFRGSSVDLGRTLVLPVSFTLP